MAAPMVVDIMAILRTVATNMRADTGPVIEQVGAWVATVAEATAVGVEGIIEFDKRRCVLLCASSLQSCWKRGSRTW